MARKTRQTTSVSTLVAQISLLRDIARTSGRKDLLKQFNLLAIRINKLVEDYEKIRAEIDPFVKIMLSRVEAIDPAKELEDLELVELAQQIADENKATQE